MDGDEYLALTVGAISALMITIAVPMRFMAPAEVRSFC